MIALYLLTVTTPRCRYLRKANDMEQARRELKYNAEETLIQAQQLKGIFAPSFWDTLPSQARQDLDGKVSPIFIIGMMRSGSTLLETMLDAHEHVWGMGEDSVFNGNLSEFRDLLVRASDNSRGTAW